MIKNNQFCSTSGIREFSQQQFRGNFLNISRAKESFLDRLKREREESMQVADHGNSSYNNDYNQNDYQQESYRPLPKIEKEIVSGESSEEDEDFEEATEVSATQLQVIKAAKTFRLDDDGKTVLTKAELDDKKRQESLKKLKDRHMGQKIAIRNALSGSTEPRNNKIIFEPPEPMEVEHQPDVKAQLFDEEDDEDETESFTVKKQFAGKNSARMLELQSQFQGDGRFKIDERFVDDSDGLIDTRKKYTREELKERKKLRKEMLNWDQDELKEERDHQLSILESITGESTGYVKSQHKPNLDKKEMLRFDPTKKEHKKYLDVVRGDEEIDDDDEDDKKDKKSDENFQVSSEKFYEVSDNLTTALQSSSKPFSIFEMLGVSHNDPDEVEEEKKPTKEEEEVEPKLLKKLPMFQLNQMKFQYDSSDTDEDEERRKQTNQKKKVPKDNQSSKGGKYSKSGVFRFNLFYTDDDPRLKGEDYHFLPIKYAIFNFQFFSHSQKVSTFSKSPLLMRRRENHSSRHVKI